MNSDISNAVEALRNGGVIAYPTEYCFGLGCDPRNESALKRLLSIKQRKKDQGVILIASNLDQVSDYANLDELSNVSRVTESWPGPNTWLLPVHEGVSSWVCGNHQTIAMRVSANLVCQQLCEQFGHAIVSTSANRHGNDALLSAKEVQAELGLELDYVINSAVDGASRASTIRDAMTGEQLR